MYSSSANLIYFDYIQQRWILKAACGPCSRASGSLRRISVSVAVNQLEELRSIYNKHLLFVAQQEEALMSTGQLLEPVSQRLRSVSLFKSAITPQIKKTNKKRQEVKALLLWNCCHIVFLLGRLFQLFVVGCPTLILLGMSH